jgi:hypothetical protein
MSACRPGECLVVKEGGAVCGEDCVKQCASSADVQQFVSCIRALVNGGAFDLTDSPKSFVSQVQQFVKELDSAPKTCSICGEPRSRDNLGLGPCSNGHTIMEEAYGVQANPAGGGVPAAGVSDRLVPAQWRETAAVEKSVTEEASPSHVAQKSRRQIVFDWLMQDEGYWGGSEEVARVDDLLTKLDAAALSHVAPRGISPMVNEDHERALRKGARNE